jgi:CheY-like chemotaxis protein
MWVDDHLHSCFYLRMRTVLLVDDDNAFRYAATRYLGSAGFRVVDVQNTMDALKEVDSGRAIDAFVVDIAMPSGNPHGMAFALMARRRRPAAPILLMTAFPDLLEDYKLPVPGKVLFKPLDLGELADEVRELFFPPPPDQSAEMAGIEQVIRWCIDEHRKLEKELAALLVQPSGSDQTIQRLRRNIADLEAVLSRLRN